MRSCCSGQQYVFLRKGVERFLSLLDFIVNVFLCLFPVVSFHGLIVREPNLGFSGHQMWNEKVMRDNNDLNVKESSMRLVSPFT